MQIPFALQVAGLAGALLLPISAPAVAAEIKVLSSVGVKGIMEELLPQFEKSTGHKVVITFDGAAALKKKIETGEPCDLAILTGPLIDELIRSSNVTVASRTDLVHSGVGIAVRRGASKPDIGSPESFRHSLQNAKSVVYADAGASGAHFLKVLQKLGLADEMKAKNQLMTNPSPIEAVAKGEAELGVRLVSEIMVVPDAELVGPFPPELQSFTVLTAGVTTNAKEPAAAKAFIEFLAAPAAVPVIQSKGLEPGGIPVPASSPAKP